MCIEGAVVGAVDGEVEGLVKELEDRWMGRCEGAGATIAAVVGSWLVEREVDGGIAVGEVWEKARKAEVLMAGGEATTGDRPGCENRENRETAEARVSATCRACSTSKS